MANTPKKPAPQSPAEHMRNGTPPGGFVYIKKG
jgi:hypothetical protein